MHFILESFVLIFILHFHHFCLYCFNDVVWASGKLKAVWPVKMQQQHSEVFLAIRYDTILAAISINITFYQLNKDILHFES